MRVAMLAVVLSVFLLPIEVDAKGKSGSSHSGSKSHRSHHHHGGRVFVGGYYFYGYPAYYYPYGVPLYKPPPEDPYRYYCRAANAYYPSVQNCPGGWERYLPGTPLG